MNVRINWRIGRGIISVGKLWWGCHIHQGDSGGIFWVRMEDNPRLNLASGWLLVDADTGLSYNNQAKNVLLDDRIDASKPDFADTHVLKNHTMTRNVVILRGSRR